MTIGEIIKQYRIEHNLSMDAFSEKSGISKSYISLLEKNKHPKSGKPISPSVQSIKQVADAIGMDFDVLFSNIDGNVSLVKNEESVLQQEKRAVTINVLGRVAAGIPIDAVEDIIDTEEITEELAKTGKFFGLQIKGDSMTPGICNGDIVIVRQQDDAESGDIVIATINGDEATCKRLRKYKEGIELISNNPSYQPFEFTNEEIKEKPVRIIGKVVELRRKF